MKLTTPLEDVLRTTGDHIDALAKMGLETVQDLLQYFPRSHEDLSQVQHLATSRLGEKVTLRGVIMHVKLVRLRGGKQMVQALFVDGDGDTAEVVWFNQPHVKRMLPDGAEVVLTGKISERGSKLQLQSPQFEIAGSKPLVHAGRLVPVYPQHDIIGTKWLREKMVLIKDAIELLPDPLSSEVLAEEDLPTRAEAVRALHFPEKPEDVERAQRRIAFDEMFKIQREALERKREWQGTEQDRIAIPMDVELVKAFFASLHFTPTSSQKIAIYEILKDMEKTVPMSRLLEGDVGSGKTLVACTVMACVMRKGGQCALMVPTEVLAKQHAQTVTRLLLNFHSYAAQNGMQFPLPRVALLTGSTPGAEAASIRHGIAAGTVDVAIGTHALIEDKVLFKDLRLVIVDEQHRFGVVQRERLKDKGNPHFLSMTATPIPRTLALTAFGDHDLSVLLEKPGNRKIIRTKVVSPGDRKTVELFIDKEIDAGRQCFVICPLISESESDDMQEVKSVAQESARLREGFPHRKISMLHGKMTPAEKEDVMRRFKDHEADILVSTSVIEVGIDVPNSTIIVIEGAERFGLSQLHQFRGRVGRSDHQSHCFLFATTPEQARSPRLKAMETHDSGFELAEIDLRLRGPGEIFGVRQSGLPPSMFTRFYQPELIVKARRAAEKALGMAPSKAAV